MKTKCYSVRLESLFSISDKAFKAVAFDGSEAILPKNQVFGRDWDVSKTEAYWIAAWVLEKKNLQYSRKKEALFNEFGKMLPKITVKQFTPQKITLFKINYNKSLNR